MTKKFVFSVFMLFFALGAIALLLPIAEQAARYFYRDITTTGDNTSWFARHWYLRELGRDLVKLNSFRAREREPSRTPAPSTYRIVVIGDSYTFGQGIPVETRLTNRLEHRLQREGFDVEVLNFGYNGTGLNHHVRKLGITLDLNPDFYLVQWTPNDFESHPSASGIHRPRPLNLIPWSLNKYHYYYHRHSVLYYLMNSGWHRFQYTIGLTESYASYMTRRFGDADSTDSKVAIRDFRNLVAAARKNNIPIGIVLFPQFVPELSGPEYPFSFLHERVLGHCTALGVTCVDLREAYRPHADGIRSLTVNQFDGHPSGFANEIAARAVLDVFGPHWRAAAREKNDRYIGDSFSRPDCRPKDC